MPDEPPDTPRAAPSSRNPKPPESEPPERDGPDAEVTAIHRTLAALSPLGEAARRRVFDYVGQRFGFGSLPGGPTVPSPPGAMSAWVQPAPPGGSPAPHPGVDIRTLKEEKQPRSLTEMVALVAYYLKEVAGPNERKETVTTPDVEKYFKQAGYRLPSRSRMVLVNARNAGYLDPTGEAGVYKLNPVGYNLVAHSLPAEKGRALARKRSKAGTAKPRA